MEYLFSHLVSVYRQYSIGFVTADVYVQSEGVDVYKTHVVGFVVANSFFRHGYDRTFLT
jgi:hypothetical protein